MSKFTRVEIYKLLLEGDYNLITVLFHLIPQMLSWKVKGKSIHFFLEYNYDFGASINTQNST